MKWPPPVHRNRLPISVPQPLFGVIAVILILLVGGCAGSGSRELASRSDSIQSATSAAGSVPDQTSHPKQSSSASDETPEDTPLSTTPSAAGSLDSTDVSETTVLETTVLETTVLETTVLETTVLETTVLETTVLETTLKAQTTDPTPSLSRTATSNEMAGADRAAPSSTVQSASSVRTVEVPVVTETVAQTTVAETTSSVVVSEVASQLRVVPEQSYTPMAVFAGVQVVHPSARVERVGFHESNHDGARQFEVLPTAVSALVLESRDRGTGSRTAADVVVDPESEIRAPVTGTVLRAGGYVLYCKHSDDFVVIEPDSHPGWELKVLHITGVQVSKGQRVEAGVTVLAPGPTQLPFDSQVDEFTAEPSWPHVHIELVDPSIPDRPSTGGGC